MISSKCSTILAYFHLLCTLGKVNVGYFTLFYLTFCSPTFHSITRRPPPEDREGTACT